MTHNELAPYVANVLSTLDGVRPTRDGWVARCPCPAHNAGSGQPGDHNPSLRITIGHDGRILIKCRVGCKTDQIVETLGLTWWDLFRSHSVAAVEPHESQSQAPQNIVQSCSDGELVHTAYESLLASLRLSECHQGELNRRGMSKEHIQLGQYRTLRNIDRGQVARHVFKKLGGDVLSVPGFVDGEFGVTLAGISTGLLIPVRDVACRIQAVKIRRSSDPKYVYLTSGESCKSSGSPVHVPRGVPCPSRIVRVTEGELKSDLAYWLEGTPTIGIPGVTQWRKAIPVLQQLEAQTVIIAFDAADLRTKPPVFNEAQAFWRSLQHEGYEVEVEDWYDDP